MTAVRHGRILNLGWNLSFRGGPQPLPTSCLRFERRVPPALGDIIALPRLVALPFAGLVDDLYRAGGRTLLAVPGLEADLGAYR
jgi:hypothetical protein